jgi:uncharacterized coiled-coil DUF342 family protein
MALAALSLISAPIVYLATTSPAAAQNDEWGAGDTDSSLRDLVQSWVQERADGRDTLMDWVQERQDRRDEFMNMLDERRDRRSEIMNFLRDHPWLRDRLRERLASRSSDEDSGGGLRGRLRERVEDRLGGDCYFLTRSLRRQDGDLLVVVRRRICRD